MRTADPELQFDMMGIRSFRPRATGLEPCALVACHTAVARRLTIGVCTACLGLAETHAGEASSTMRNSWCQPTKAQPPDQFISNEIPL